MEFEISLDDLANDEGAIVNSEGHTKSETEVTLEDLTNSGNRVNNTSIENSNESQEEEVGIDIDKLSELSEMFITDGKNAEEIETPVSSESTIEQISPQTSNAFSSFAAALKDAGVLSSLEDENIKEIKSSEELIKAIEKQVQKNEYAKLTPKQKKYLEAVEAGIEEEKAVQYTNALSEYNSVSEDQIKSSKPLQKELFKRSFLVKGFDAESAEKYAELALTSPTVEEDAVKTKETLVAHITGLLETEKEEALNAKTELQKKEEELITSLKSKINESSQILPGITVNSNTKEKIFNSLTTPVGKNNESLLNEVMKSYTSDNEYKVRLHALHVITKGFTDFSKFKTTSKSDVIKTFDETLANTAMNSLVSKSVEGATTSSIKEALKHLKF